MISFHEFDPVLWPIVRMLDTSPCCVFVGLEDKSQTDEMTAVPNESTIMVRDADNAILINGVLANIRAYRVIVPEKVVQVFFYDGGKEKVVLKEGDTFDLDRGLLIATAKHVGRQYYNLKGIEDIADRLSHLKCIDKMLATAHKNTKREDAEKEASRQQKIADLERKAKANAKAREKANRKKCEVKRRDYPHCNHYCPSSDDKQDNHKLSITKRKHGHQK